MHCCESCNSYGLLTVADSNLRKCTVLLELCSLETGASNNSIIQSTEAVKVSRPHSWQTFANSCITQTVDHGPNECRCLEQWQDVGLLTLGHNCCWFCSTRSAQPRLVVLCRLAHAGPLVWVLQLTLTGSTDGQVVDCRRWANNAGPVTDLAAGPLEPEQVARQRLDGQNQRTCGTWLSSKCFK